MKIMKFTDKHNYVWGYIMLYPQIHVYIFLLIWQNSKKGFLADKTPYVMKLSRVTKFRVLFLILVSTFHYVPLYYCKCEFLATISEKDQFPPYEDTLYPTLPIGVNKFLF